MGKRKIIIAVALLAFPICGFALHASAQDAPGASTVTSEETDDVERLSDQAKKLLDEGKYAEVVPLAEQLLLIVEKAYGPDHPMFGLALTILATPLMELGRYPEAEPLYKRSLAILERALGVEHPDVGAALKNLAWLYETQGRYAEAEPLYNRAIAIAETVLGHDHADVGAALNNIGRLHRRRGRYAEAEASYKRSLAILQKALGADHPGITTTLNNLGVLYESQGRFREAESLLLRSLALREKAFGPNSPEVASSLSNLGELYQTLGRFDTAEQMFRRSLTIRESTLGADHVDTALTINNLGGLMQVRGRYREAEPLYKRALAIWEKSGGPEHPDVGMALNNLAGLYQRQDRYADAESLLLRSLSIAEKSLGQGHENVAYSLNSLAFQHRAAGRFADAESLHKRSLAIVEKALGNMHPEVAGALYSLASFYREQGRYGEAEPLNKHALEIAEKALGTDHPSVAVALGGLGDLYSIQERFAEAVPLYERSLAIREKALGPEHVDVGGTLLDLGRVNTDLGRYDRAEPLLTRSLAIYERLFGAEHSRIAPVLHNLAGLKLKLGHYDEAESLLKRCIAITDRTLGADHPDVVPSLNNLAQLYQRQGRFEEARSLYQRSLDIAEGAFGPHHSLLATALNNLAWLALWRHDWAGAAEYWKRATQIHLDRAALGLAGHSEASRRRETARFGWQFSGLVKATYRLGPAGRGQGSPNAEGTFEIAQWAQSWETAAAVAQMAARSTKGSPEIADLVRERQDLTAEWHAKDRVLIAAKSKTPSERIPEVEAGIADRVAAIERRLAAINARLESELQDYAELVSPKSMSSADVQAILQDNEALVLFLDTDERFDEPLPEETFVWVVTRTDMRWVSVEAGTRALTDTVAALRCGLDRAAWLADQGARCRALLSLGHNPADDVPLPFSPGIAHEVYEALFGEVADLIKDKHLLLVPSGPLTTLPFQVLVTKEPATGAGFRDVAWLAREHALTVLPSVASLKALRRNARPSAAPQPFVGFGNPLLTGPAGATPPFEIDSCASAALFEKLAAVDPALSAPNRTLGAATGIEDVRRLEPVPATASLLCNVAKRLGAPESDVHLGSGASETAVKSLNDAGRLKDYRIVHFATHGLVAGELSQLNEPALVLTPPPAGTADATALERDNGLLTASEVATLKLDADWVILSACNTAAGGSGAAAAEALSGLARTFFYAGARALLVSHWYVSERAALRLATLAFEHQTAGRAEAVRRAMLSMIDTGQPHDAHPSYWAPFVVVGEGAAAQ